MKPESTPATAGCVTASVAWTKRIRQQKCAYSLAMAIVLGLAMAASPSAQGQSYKEKVLYQFSGTTDGANPYAGLISDAKGNLYGTATLGGTGTGCSGSSCGVVFKVTAGGKETVLHSFAGPPNDGAFPYGGLLSAVAGVFHGTTYQGGKHGFGTVFSLSTAGKEKVLYNFKGSPDGDQPCSGLLADGMGNFYGITDHGGKSGFGTVFELTKANLESVIYSFTTISFPGSLPCATLISDGKGSLYGTTYFGGTSGLGSVFKVTKAGVETVLHSFTGPDGAFPVGGLLADGKGNLFGTTSAGGTTTTCGGVGCGVVFKLDKKGNETVLHPFDGRDGEVPYGVLIEDTKGNLYGTTTLGGAAGFGTVFKVTQASKETVLWSFKGGDDGVSPFAGLLSDAKGDLFGTTEQGGFAGVGVVFELIP